MHKTFTYKNLTTAGRVTMPIYTFFALAVGLAYFFGDASRTNTPSFATARDMMPIRYWGVVFFVVGLIKTSAWVTKYKEVMIFGLICGMTMCVVWSGIFFYNLFSVPDSSITAPLLWLVIAGFHWASLESLKKDMS